MRMLIIYGIFAADVIVQTPRHTWAYIGLNVFFFLATAASPYAAYVNIIVIAKFRQFLMS